MIATLPGQGGNVFRRALSCLLLLAVCAPLLAADSAPSFQSDIAPVLTAHCLKCHNGSRARGELDLTRREGLLTGGSSGSVLTPGQAADSLLFEYVRDKKMPPRQALNAAQIEVLRRWIDAGAVWQGPALKPPRVQAKRAGRAWWSLRPIRRPTLPAVSRPAWLRTPLDAFILARLDRQGLQPAPEVDRRTYIRRVTFDLTGLPPLPEEIDAFVADASADAYEKLVDRLLASPAYGERWARHWLDVVRFAESHGYEMNTLRPNAWPYRDYVIRAFNEDTPYPRFIREQLAGDVLAGPDALGQAATGFLVGGPHDMVGNATRQGQLQQRMDDLFDMVSTTGATFLGLTVGCARCHDHKFDPISQRDFYALQAFFAGVEHAERAIVVPEGEECRPIDDRLRSREKPMRIYAGTFRTPDRTHLLQRGDPLQPLEEVQPSAPAQIGPRLRLKPTATEGERRLALADWLAHPDNPLPARVMVNRVWHWHFGQGLVRTPSDFGFNGDRPSHPELLDWLASRFQANGWRLKPLHRLIVLSNTYRQAGRLDARAAAVDASNRLLWRYPPRRLEAEAIRDAMLQVSGALNRRMGGPGYHLWEYSGYVIVFKPKTKLGPEEFRRMIYQFKPRLQQDRTFGVFDCPDATTTLPRRNRSTTALQALNLLNDPFVVDQSERFAARLRREAGRGAEAQVRRAFRLAFGRSPSAAEARAAGQLVRTHGLAALCRALFNANEFVFVN